MPWLSIHFYPVETQDVFLARALKPFLEQYVWSKTDVQAFFIRFQDEKGPHIRIRIRGEESWLEDLIRPAFAGWFVGRGEWQEASYVPEPARFGGEEALLLAEQYFHASTRMVLQRIGRDQFTYGDAMFDALRLHIITLFSIGFTREKTTWYFDQLYDQWLPLFFPVEDAALLPDITTSFEQTLEPQKEQLGSTLDAFWNALDWEKYDKTQPEWLEWLQENTTILKSLEGNMEKALPSLIHLTNNRLGINNQDEVYLNYILSRVL